MKFYCDKCNAKYAISDEKVRGKILKVRCKKCAHIITVREPVAPAAQSAPVLPQTKRAQTQWHYSINGQTFGPFPESELLAKYEDGSVQEASYIWNETFDGWKPAKDVEPFASALSARHAVRPPARTMGVSDALQAISIQDASPSTQTEGQAPNLDLSNRLDSLRSKLQQAKAQSAQASPATSEPKPSGGIPNLSLSSPFDTSAASDVSDVSEPVIAAEPQPELQPEPLEPQSPLADLSGGASSVAIDIQDDDFFGPADDAPAIADLFEDEGPATPAAAEPLFEFSPDAPSEDIDFGSTGIDFSALDKKGGMFGPTALNLPDPSDGSKEFVATNSLLIQLDEIKKQGRSKRVVVRGVLLVVLLLVIGVGGFVYYQNQKNKKDLVVATQQPEQKAELIIPTYAKSELMTFGEEEVLNIKQMAKEEAAAQLADEKAAKAARVPTKSTTKRAPVAVASKGNSVPTKKGLGLGISASDLTGSKSGLDSALNASKAKSQGGSQGLSTTRSGGRSVTADTDLKPGRGKSASLATAMLQGSTSPSRPIYKPKADNPTKRDSAGVLPAGTLTKTELKRGFKKVRRSVASCYQRHVSRGLTFDNPKVKVTVEILGTGRVSKVMFNQSRLANSEFGQCMNQRKSTWIFREYGGKPLKIAHTYVLQ